MKDRRDGRRGERTEDAQAWTGLPDSRVRNRQPQLLKVTDRVHCALGYSVSNAIYVITDASLVVIDTTEGLTAARQSLADFRQVSGLPVSHIIYTHFHGDHIRGAAAFHGQGTQILAHRLMPEELARNNMLLPYRERVNAVQLGTPLSTAADGTLLTDPDDGFVAPDILVDDQYRFEHGGQEFELFHVPGETADHLAVWLPREKVLCCGDLFYRCFPMLSNPFKRDRPVRHWIDSLDRLRALDADSLVPSHGPPVRVKAEVRAKLSRYAEAIRHVHDETIRGIRSSVPVERLAARVRLPDQLAALPYLQERYGTVRWAVKGIFRQYTGWYDSNPAHLNPGPRHALAAALLDAAGGPAAFLQRARRELASGHDQVVLELTRIVLEVHTGHPRARALRLAALRRLADWAPNALERNIYRAAADALSETAAAAAPADEQAAAGAPEPWWTSAGASHRSSRKILFVLAPPRSFTSVVGTMLGQHPQLYGLPETHLFGCETMSDWWTKCDDQTFPRADGLVRAVAELVFGGQTEENVPRAKRWLRRRSYYSTAMVMEVLATRAHPRIPVDKSPSVVYDVRFLERIRTAFPEARFLHLLRHPRSHGESVMRFLNERRQRGPVPPSHWLLHLSTYPHPSSANGDPRATTLDPQHGWLALNRNISNFLQSLPDDRKLVVRGEDLLRSPDEPLRRIAAWMGVRTDDEAVQEMKHPERSPYARFGPAGARYGNDAFFLEDPALRAGPAAPQTLDGPLGWREDGAPFLPEVKQLAWEFGYA